MTSPVEAAQNAALGRIDRAEPSLLADPFGNDPDPFTRTDAAGRCDEFRYEVASAAGGADPVEACRLATQDAEPLASEMTGAAS